MLGLLEVEDFVRHLGVQGYLAGLVRGNLFQVGGGRDEEPGFLPILDCFWRLLDLSDGRLNSVRGRSFANES